MKCLLATGAVSSLTRKGNAITAQSFLGPDVKFWHIEDQTIFPMYSSSGWLSSRWICFPMYEHGDYWIVYGHVSEDTFQHCHLGYPERKAMVEKEAMVKFHEALMKNPAMPVRRGGDQLPENGEIVKFRRDGR